MERFEMERNDTAVVRHGGRDFIATAEMTQIFRRQAERVLAAGTTELVVLRHQAGIDLVLITNRESYSITPRPFLAKCPPAVAKT
jgi:hypothetical protein